ncbi:MAG: maltodextrin glucosidase [Clostridia bacterium]|jgi:cyclomaltodextrinase|nr:maltodextrin glucosidase [Clostridia bacterium]
MDFKNTVMYQIYPLGYCGAEPNNDGGAVRHRLHTIADRIETLRDLNVNAVLLNPLLESSAHGYDTIDFFSVDRRLGDEADIRSLIAAMHEAGIRVVFDGVFHHVGRDFFAFRDVRERLHESAYRDWFIIDFGGNSPYNDGFHYQPWEGHYELVKLNLDNPDVQNHLFDAVRKWIDWGIDGLRLDVAYLLPPWFLRLLRQTVEAAKPGFYLVGEMIHGEYGRRIAPDMLDSVTNYACYKSLYSAFNSRNLFEIEHGLTRLFAAEPWALCRGMNLLNFADNHDVTRIASILNDRRLLAPLYALLFAMPGTPCLYYGSEWGQVGRKEDGDAALRPSVERCDASASPELRALLSRLAHIKRTESALDGDYKKLYLTNTALSIERGGQIVAAVNIADAPHTVPLPGAFKNLLDGAEVRDAIELPPFGYALCKRI